MYSSLVALQGNCLWHRQFMDKIVGIAGCQGFNGIPVHPGSMEAGLFWEHVFETLLSQSTIVKWILHTYWTSVCKFERGEHTSSWQVILETSDDQDHADEHSERRLIISPVVAVGSTTSRKQCDSLKWFILVTWCSISHNSCRRLHPNCLNLSMSMMWIWRCIDWSTFTIGSCSITCALWSLALIVSTEVAVGQDNSSLVLVPPPLLLHIQGPGRFEGFLCP